MCCKMNETTCQLFCFPSSCFKLFCEYMMFIEVVLGFIVETCELLLLLFVSLENVVFFFCRGILLIGGI